MLKYFKFFKSNFCNSQLFAKILIERTHNLPCGPSKFLEHLWLVEHIYFDSENNNTLFIIIILFILIIILIIYLK